MLDHAASGPDSALPPSVSETAGDEQDSLVGHIERLLLANRPAAARPLLMALKRRDPQSTRAMDLEARLLLAEGQDLAALRILDAAIAQAEAGSSDRAQAPANAMGTLYLLRAQIHVGRGDLAGAIDSTAAAVMCDPSAPAPKLRLGVLLTEMGRLDEAIACLQEAVAGQPVPDAFRALATVYERAGRHAEASAMLADAVRNWPKEQELRAAAVMRAIRRRDYRDAVELARAARRDGAINAEIFAMMGHAFASLGEHVEAATSYRDALKFAPADAFLRQIAELSEAAGDGDRVAPERVRSLFDLVAAGFDQHIVSLGYRIPGLIRNALLQLQSAGQVGLKAPVLDLGCGTGLVSLAINDLVGPITGFDVSPSMLSGARAKNLFTELREGDLLALLKAESRCWPVIVAGDVITYFGALDDLMRAASARLSPGGALIFSATELCAASDGSFPRNEGWAFVLGGRFVHSRDYVENALNNAQLAIRSISNETLRFEARMPVAGWIVVAGHAGGISPGGQA
jgi:predicted TPR repeat methyltransferase